METELKYAEMERIMSRVTDKIYCNRCGKLICTEDKKEQTSFLTIQKEWGYFSEEKDGLIHKMDICEPCYEVLIQEFAIPPEQRKKTELI